VPVDISEIVPVRNDLSVLQGSLRLSAITTAKYFVPRFGTFRHRYPGINISLQVTNRQRVLERLSENLDDLYILGQPPASLDINLRPVRKSLVVIAPTIILWRKRRIFLTAPCLRAIYCVSLGQKFRMTVERFFNENRVAIKVEMEIGSNEAIKQATR